MCVGNLTTVSSVYSMLLNAHTLICLFEHTILVVGHLLSLTLSDCDQRDTDKGRP